MPGREIDLLAAYPKSVRDIDERGEKKTAGQIAIARQFGFDFFDGDRRFGYGGYHYNPRFWRPVIPAIWAHFKLTSQSSVLDVGCGKGFLLHDLAEMIPGITVAGVDLSSYAIKNCLPSVAPFVSVGNAMQLFYPDGAFDVVLSINTLHNLRRDECIMALREIERVKRKGAFITVDAFRTAAERVRMLSWNLTARTVLHVDDWKELFQEAGYTGDYYWFTP